MSSPYGSVEDGATPLSANGEHQVLLTQAGLPFSGAAGTTVLPASGVWTASQVMPCDKQRRICLEFWYDANAATVAGAAEVLVLLCKQKLNAAETGAPAIADDVWYAPTVPTSSGTSGALAAGALAAGSTFSIGMTFQKVTYAPLAIEIAPVTANSAKARAVLEIDGTSSFWWYLQARELGDQTNRGILNIRWSLGI